MEQLLELEGSYTVFAKGLDTVVMNARDLTPMQIVIGLDFSEWLVLERVKSLLDASSFNEVVRRALWTYRFFKVEHGDTRPTDTTYRAGAAKSPMKEIHVRLSPATKAILEEHKRIEGGSYSSVISNALSTFAELVERQHEKDAGGTTTQRHADEVICPMDLALV